VDIQRVLDAWARENTRLAGFDLPDPIAMAVALDPSVATGARRLFVAVETGGTWSRGQTVVDHLGVTGREPNVEVVTEASRGRFWRSCTPPSGRRERQKPGYPWGACFPMRRGGYKGGRRVPGRRGDGMDARRRALLGVSVGSGPRSCCRG
jgi:hypothetical protein